MTGTKGTDGRGHVLLMVSCADARMGSDSASCKDDLHSHGNGIHSEHAGFTRRRHGGSAMHRHRRYGGSAMHRHRLGGRDAQCHNESQITRQSRSARSARSAYRASARASVLLARQAVLMATLICSSLGLRAAAAFWIAWDFALSAAAALAACRRRRDADTRQ